MVSNFDIATNFIINLDEGDMGEAPKTEPSLDEDGCQMAVKHQETAEKTNELIRNSEMFNAAIEGNDFDTVRSLLRAGFNLNNPFTVNCVRHATSKNNLNITKLLVEYQADVNSDAFIDSALCVAIEKGYADIAEFLISCEANVYETNSSELCFLHTIIWFLKTNLVEAKKKLHDFENHVCNIEREYNYFRIMKCLLRKSSSRINENCCNGRTPLCSMTIDLYSFQVVFPFTKLLIKFGADVNVPSRRRTPFFYAIKWCQEGLVKIFLKYGATVDIKINENNKMNILHYAIKKNRFSVIKQIMNHIYIDINSEKYYYHALPLLHYTVKKACPGILRAFLIAGGDATQTDKNGTSLLQTYLKSEVKRSLKSKECLRLIIFFTIAQKERVDYRFTYGELRSMYADWDAFKFMEKVLAANVIRKISDTLPVNCLQIIYANDAELAELVKKHISRNLCVKDIFAERHDVGKDVFEDLIRKGRKRLKILSKANVIERIADFLSPSTPLNIHCMEKIISMLSNLDIINLLRAINKKEIII